MKETWAEACARQLQACGDPTPYVLDATGLRIPGPPRTRKQEWSYRPRKADARDGCHDPRCISLTVSEFSRHCDCKTLLLIDQENAKERAESRDDA